MFIPLLLPPIKGHFLARILELFISGGGWSLDRKAESVFSPFLRLSSTQISQVSISNKLTGQRHTGPDIWNIHLTESQICANNTDYFIAFLSKSVKYGTVN